MLTNSTPDTNSSTVTQRAAAVWLAATWCFVIACSNPRIGVFRLDFEPTVEGVATYAVHSAGFAAVLLLVEMFFFAMISWLGCAVMRVKSPGILLLLVFGTLAGALAIIDAGVCCPQIVHVHDRWFGLALGLANTILIWLFGLITHTARSNINLLPFWRK